MTNNQNLIFGRHDSDRHDEYFAIVNATYNKINLALSDYRQDLIAISKGDQESEDFDDDILNLFSDIEKNHGDVLLSIGRHLAARQ